MKLKKKISDKLARRVSRMTPAKIVTDEDHCSSDSDSNIKFDFTAYTSKDKR